jgi:vacuolar-type H+-ATPase subunit H
MEELKSTEALNREILEDARKKALKILNDATESVNASKTAWEQKLEHAQETVRSGYAEKTEQLRKGIMARLPMDKRRIRSETIDRFLRTAMDDFLRSLDHSSLLRILEGELAFRAGDISQGLSGGGEIRYRLLSEAECKTLVSGVFPGLSLHYIEDPLHALGGAFPALVIDFPHLRITVSVDRTAETLLQDKRAELTAALLGNIEDLTLPGGGNG